MARDNARWLKTRAIFARTVTIKVRYDDFTTITRSHSSAPTDDEEDVVRRAVALIGKTECGARPVRLLGAGVHNLVGEIQEDDEDEAESQNGRLPFED